MARRVRGNSHARCRRGENLEITSKSYLSVSADQFSGLFAGAHVSVHGAYHVGTAAAWLFGPAAGGHRHIADGACPGGHGDQPQILHQWH